MWIRTVRIPKRALALSLCAVFCCAAVLFLFPSPVLQASSEAFPEPEGVRTGEDRVSYLARCGWEVEREPVMVEELLLPQALEEDDYLALQRAQGFDLERCAGKRVRRYTYKVLSHPSGRETVLAELLIRRGRVVGGAVYSPQSGGFLHGLMESQCKNGQGV